MAFPAELLEGGISIANSLTSGVQVAITWEAWLSQDGEGRPTYADPVTLFAVLDMTRKTRSHTDGVAQTIIATITIIGDVTPNGSPGRREPIDTRDRITLPTGEHGPLMDVPNAVVNPNTGRPFINTLMMGEDYVTNR